MPSQIGKYDIESELGRGGASVVYLAMDRVLNRRVALKVLPHYLGQDPEVARRFMREAEVVARLQHPNIITIYDVGQAGQDGQELYIAMEYVEGQSLDRLVKSSPKGLLPAEAVRIVTQIAEALQYTHSQGIVHRDLKPANVLVDTAGHAKLTDFGLAILTSGAGGGVTVTAAGGPVMGTPGYMAPEVIQGQGSDVRTDIYGLGAVLYNLLSGQRPFDGETPVASLFKAINETPARPSSLRADIPAALDDIALKALATKPGDRFATAAAMAAALAQYSGALSAEDSWPAWSWSIRRILLQQGQLRAVDIGSLVPSAYVGYAIERFGRETKDLALEATSEGITLKERARLLEVNEALQGLRERRATAPPLRELLAWMERPTPALADLFVHLVQQIANAIGSTFAPLGGVQAGLDVFPASFSLDTRRAFAGTRLPGALPVVFSARDELDDEDLSALRDCLCRHCSGAPLGLLLMVGSDEAVNEARTKCDVLRRVYGTDAVVLSKSDLRKILAAPDPGRALRKAVFAQVNLTTVSPFVTNGPVPPHVFFGREDVLHDIVAEVRNTSFAVVGGRRIGKSSLLARLHRERLPAAGFQTLYHDCSTTPTFDEFRESIARFWEPPRVGDLPTFGAVFESPPLDRPLVLLLDEADKLVPLDRANGRWPLFTTLRALGHSGKAQVILCGERPLAEAMRDSASPLFNFTNRILLGRLEYAAVEELVTAPLAELEIELTHPEEMVKRIWAFTSGHPNVVQRLCRRLIERVNEQTDRRITLDDLHYVLDDPAFQEHDFLETYWERATALEKILSLVLTRELRPRRLQGILDLLRAEGLTLQPELVRAALDRLVELRSLLKRGPQGYEFAVEAFPRVLRKAAISEDLLLVLKSECDQDLGEEAG